MCRVKELKFLGDTCIRSCPARKVEGIRNKWLITFPQSRERQICVAIHILTVCPHRLTAATNCLTLHGSFTASAVVNTREKWDPQNTFISLAWCSNLYSTQHKNNEEKECIIRNSVYFWVTIYLSCLAWTAVKK